VVDYKVKEDEEGGQGEDCEDAIGHCG
jgi:hypothetical protein